MNELSCSSTWLDSIFRTENDANWIQLSLCGGHTIDGLVCAQHARHGNQWQMSVPYIGAQAPTAPRIIATTQLYWIGAAQNLCESARREPQLIVVCVNWSKLSVAMWVQVCRYEIRADIVLTLPNTGSKLILYSYLHMLCEFYANTGLVDLLYICDAVSWSITTSCMCYVYTWASLDRVNPASPTSLTGFCWIYRKNYQTEVVFTLPCIPNNLFVHFWITDLSTDRL